MRKRKILCTRARVVSRLFRLLPPAICLPSIARAPRAHAARHQRFFLFVARQHPTATFFFLLFACIARRAPACSFCDVHARAPRAVRCAPLVGDVLKATVCSSDGRHAAASARAGGRVGLTHAAAPHRQYAQRVHATTIVAILSGAS